MSSSAIVIPCYNRVNSLSRLLGSIEKAFTESEFTEVPLVFSIDYSGNEEIRTFAENYNWSHGPKEVINHPQNLGLKKNILFCGDLTEKYDSVIVLEDDTIVSPSFYHYAYKTLTYYRDEAAIAQISLYAYEYSEVSSERFHPLYDGQDVYFMQWPSSRGQLWTRKQWARFRDWLNKNPELVLDPQRIPGKCYNWVHSWKKHFADFLVDQNLYVVYPYHGLATNFGETGTNVLIESNPEIQSPLSLSFPENLRLPLFIEGRVFYDVYFQPTPHTLNLLLPDLVGYDYDVDLQSSKPFTGFQKEYLLSTRTCKQPLKTYSWNIFPFEMNLFLGSSGSEIRFGRRIDFKPASGRLQSMKLAFWTKRLMKTGDLLRFFPLRLWVTLQVKLRLFSMKTKAE